jgi:hypothetical protein
MEQIDGCLGEKNTARRKLQIFLQKRLAFLEKVCYYSQAVSKTN